MPDENFKEEYSISEKYKKIKFYLLLIIGVLFAIFLLSWTAQKIVLIKKEFKKVDYSIDIQGEGKVVAIPNVAEVDISVISEAKTPDKAAQDNIEKVNKIIVFLKSKNIDEKDIKTINYNLSPKYQYSKGKSEIIGYAQSQTLLVKIRKFEQVGAIVKGVVEAGANQIGDLRFTIDDPEIYKTQAREKAILNAKQKAKSLAEAAGIKLGKIIDIVEGSVYFPQPYYLKEEAYGVGGGGIPAPSIERGSQEITVSVTVKFAVK